jgi:hypothetical protein
MKTTDCEALRRELKALAEKVLALRGGDRQASNMDINAGWVEANGEATANVMLAYRHLEDASMRLGKAIQALDGGVSVYDKTQVPATP